MTIMIELKGNRFQLFTHLQAQFAYNGILKIAVDEKSEQPTPSTNIRSG